MRILPGAISPVVRVRHGALQTPLYELAHRTTNSNISLVGTVHAGEQQYFDTIAQYISQQEEAGAIVHYETVRPASEAEAAQYPTEVEQARLVLGGLRRFYDLIGHNLDLEYQKRGIAYSQHWQNHDISAPELMRRLGPTGVERLSRAGEVAGRIERLDPLLQQLILRGILRAMPAQQRVSSVKKQSWKKVIVDDRNTVALAGVDTTLAANPDQDIVLLWGANHTPGIGKGLQRRGYRVTNKRWLNAFSIGFTPRFISEAVAALAEGIARPH